MRKTIIYATAIILTFCFSSDILAQEDNTTVPSENSALRKIQPKIMVIPYTTSNQSVSIELQKNDLARLAISKVKEAFDKRNFPTVDLNAKLKILENDKVMELENQSSIKQELIEISGADIYVETETTINRSSGGNSVTIILSAYDAYTGISLANKSGVSPRFYTESFEKLVDKATQEMVDDFMNLIQNRFDDMNANGRMIAMNISFSEGSEIDMDTEYDNLEMLSDKIETWLVKNSYNSYYHIQGVTATKMIVDEIRVPLKNDDGSNFRISKFVQSFRKYLKTLDITTTRDLQGGRIFITIE